jgi:putative cell wall-binding protein
VYLATGTSYADALATGGLAGTAPGPLLLAGTCSLPAETSAELQRLHPSRITVVGGPGAVCDAVAADAGRVAGASVFRRSGPDRYATAVALSQTGFPQTTPTVYLASGETFADGLSGGALAARGRGPLLLTSRCSLPGTTADELARLAPTRVVVMGGEGAVCNEVINAVRARVPGATVDRVSGADRFATSVAAAGLGWPGTAGTVYIAGGGGFADGLAAGVAAAGAQGPLLLVPACGDVPSSVIDALGRLRPTNVVVVGGPAAVCEQVLDRLRQATSG